MPQDVLDRLASCFTGDLVEPNAPQAQACVEALGELDARDRSIIAAFVDYRLSELGYPDPREWLVSATLHMLGRALVVTPIHRAHVTKALSVLADLMTAHDPLGRAWTLARAGSHGAVLRVEQRACPGTGTAYGAEPTARFAPRVQFWWRSGGAVWMCHGIAPSPKGGMFAPNAAGGFDTMVLASALLAVEGRLDRASLSGAIRAWRGRRRGMTMGTDSGEFFTDHPTTLDHDIQRVDAEGELHSTYHKPSARSQSASHHPTPRRLADRACVSSTQADD